MFAAIAVHNHISRIQAQRSKLSSLMPFMSLWRQ